MSMGWNLQLYSPKGIETDQLSYTHQYLKLNINCHEW